LDPNSIGKRSTMINISKAFINQKLFLLILFIGPELTMMLYSYKVMFIKININTYCNN